MNEGKDPSVSKTRKILNEHVKHRAEERYGLSLNKHDRREIVNKIQTNDATFVASQSNSRTLWKVSCQDETLNVVYDKKRHVLCTVLPQNAWEFQSPQAEVNCSVTPTSTTAPIIQDGKKKF